MEFELPKETVESLGLSEDQLKGISEHVGTYANDLQTSIHDEYKQKGNKYAQGIFDSVVSPFSSITGIKPNEGEKLQDFYKRAGEEYSKSFEQKHADLITQYKDTIKNGKGSEALMTQITELQDERDKYKAIAIEHEELKAGDWQNKYTTLQGQVEQATRDNAFISVRPNFPESVNKFEADHYYGEFRKGIEEKYNIVKVDDDYICIDKEHEHKRFKLSDLVVKNEKLTELSKGRVQSGLGSTTEEKTQLDGIPFELPTNASGSQISEAIQNYLISEKKMEITDDNWHKEFSTLHKKVREAQQTTA